MKVLDVKPFHEGLQQNITRLDRLEGEMSAIEMAVEGLVVMDDSLKGQGGDAIRTFYNECHLPFLRYFKAFKSNFERTLKEMDTALDGLEPDPNGFIREDFLEGDIEDGLREISQLTSSLTDEANDIMNQVADIVSLPNLDDSDVQEAILDARRKRDQTVVDLNEFDANQTRALVTIESDLHTMATWISDIEGLFTDGVTGIDFPMEKWMDLTAQNMLKTDLTQYTVEMDGIAGMTGLDGQPATMLGADTDGGKAVTYPGSFGYGPGDLYGMGAFSLPGMGSQANPFQSGVIRDAMGFTTGAVITSNGKNMACEVTSAQPTNIKKENKVLGFFNPLKKSWNSFKEIGTDIKTAAKTRGNKAFDSPYDFVNWVTIGASDGIYTGAVDRTSKKHESFYDFTNYWTVGLPDLVKGATAPEDQFSKEHWLSSFGLATSVIGGVKAVTPTKPMGGVGEGLAKPKETIKSAEENHHKGTGEVGKVEVGVEAVVSKYKDKIEYEYNMIENPGPLAGLDSKPIKNFYGGKYNAKELQEDLILYRAGESGGLTIPGKEKNALGQWFTTDPAESVVKVRIDLAVKSQWIDPKTGVLMGTSPIDATYKIRIPKGTTIYEGPVGYQGGSFSGGMDMNQIFVQEPWKIKDLEVLKEIPLK